jgi:nitrogenase molybdenum-iron protein NifN
MNELTTILGGADIVEQAIATIYDRARPRVIGLCSTALTETSGEDIAADLRQTWLRRTDWQELDVVFASTPDYLGGLQDGWGRAVEAIVEQMVPSGRVRRTLRQVNLLPGSHLTPADVEELRDIIESFGLAAVVCPDLSHSLDGHVPDDHVPTSLGGTPVTAIRTLGQSIVTLAIGEQMRPAAEALYRRTGVPCRVLASVTGLDATDSFVTALMEAGGTMTSERLKRDRSRLVDAMLDGHFYFSGRRVAIAAEPDLLVALASFLTGMGARIDPAVTTTPSAAASALPDQRLIVGDLDDLEREAAGCDLVIGSAHTREPAKRLGIPLYRAGFPIFDRLGNAARLSVGYRGTRQLLFDLANLLIEGESHPHAPSHLADDRPKQADHAPAQVG